MGTIAAIPPLGGGTNGSAPVGAAAPPRKKTLKVVILGDSGVGKTSLLNRYATDKFTGQYKATIGADFVTKECVVTDWYGQRHVVTLQLWDTAGQERFQSLGVAFYRGADCAMLVYDLTDAQSLENLSRWQQEFLNQVGGPVPGLNATTAQFPFVVVGNKSDKTADRAIPADRAKEWCETAAQQLGVGGAQQRPLIHYEASAKTGLSVEDAFHEMARLALQYEDFKQRSTPQLFVPPTPGSAQAPIDLRRSTEAQRKNEACC